MQARRDQLDVDRIRVTLRLLESALDRRDLVTELDHRLAAARRVPTDPRP